MTEDFLLSFRSWTEWAAKHPEEYKKFDILAKAIFNGREISRGDPRSNDYRIYKLKPWPQVYAFMGRCIKDGYDPEQVYLAVEFIVTKNQSFMAHPCQFALLKKVMADNKISVEEKRWQQYKMYTPKPMKSILKEILNKLEDT